MNSCMFSHRSIYSNMRNTSINSNMELFEIVTLFGEFDRNQVEHNKYFKSISVLYFQCILV